MPSQIRQTSRLSDAARERFLAKEGHPPLVSDWRDCAMIHYDVDPDALQREVPFELDLYDGRAFVSLVAFTMHDLRTRRRPRLGRRLFQPIGTHGFLNVRTYVRVGDEVGIYFLAEFLPNRLSVLLGPTAYGLPYRYGKLTYSHDASAARWEGCVAAKGAIGGHSDSVALRYEVNRDPRAMYEAAEAGSLTEFLMERYTAYTMWRHLVRRFRIWHEPWPQSEVNVRVFDASLLASTGEWAMHARLHSANASPGVANVWMGRPRRVTGGACIAQCSRREQAGYRVATGATALKQCGPEGVFQTREEACRRSAKQ